MRTMPKLLRLGIRSNEIIVGPEGYQTYARIFYRDKHARAMHIYSKGLTPGEYRNKAR